MNTENQNPQAITASIAMECLGMLNSMVRRGEPHTQATEAKTVAAFGYLRQVALGALMPKPCELIDAYSIGLAAEIKTLQQALADNQKALNLANSRADALEEYGSYYLALRDGATHLVVSEFTGQAGPIAVYGDELDERMESILAPKAHA